MVFKGSQWLIGLCSVVALVGCSRSSLLLQPKLSDSLKGSNAKLVRLPISRWMDTRDQQALLDFVDRAGPEQSCHWRHKIVVYTVTSESIFLNTCAQPCRRYQVQRRLLLSRPLVSVETACRNIKGQWVREN